MIDEYRALTAKFVLSDSGISEMIKEDLETGKLPKEFAILATEAQKTGYNVDFLKFSNNDKKYYIARDILTKNKIGFDSPEGYKIYERIQNLPVEAIELLKDTTDLKDALEENDLEPTFDNISNVLEIIYGVTLRNEEELKVSEPQRNLIISQIQAANIMASIFSQEAQIYDQYTDNMGLFEMGAEGIGYILNKVGLEGENKYQWADSCREWANRALNLKVLNPQKFNEGFKKLYQDDGKYGISFKPENFTDLYNVISQNKMFDANGRYTEEAKAAALKAFNKSLCEPYLNGLYEAVNAFGEATLMIATLGVGSATRGGQMLATTTYSFFSKAGVTIASKSVKSKMLQGALRLSGKGVKLLGPALNEGTKMALYTMTTGTVANATNRIVKADSEENSLEKFLQTETMAMEGAKGSFAFGAFAGVFGSTVTQKVVQKVSKVSSKVSIALTDKFAKGAVEANEVFATIMEKSVPTAIAETAAFATDVLGFTAFETALALYHQIDCPEEEKPEKFTEMLWKEFKGQGYNLGQIKIVSHLVMWLSGSRGARMASTKYLKENLPQLNGATIEQLGEGYKIKLKSGAVVECKNTTEMISSLYLMVRGETALSGKFVKADRGIKVEITNEKALEVEGGKSEGVKSEGAKPEPSKGEYESPEVRMISMVLEGELCASDSGNAITRQNRINSISVSSLKMSEAGIVEKIKTSLSVYLQKAGIDADLPKAIIFDYANDAHGKPIKDANRIIFCMSNGKLMVNRYFLENIDAVIKERLDAWIQEGCLKQSQVGEYQLNSIIKNDKILDIERKCNNLSKLSLSEKFDLMGEIAYLRDISFQIKNYPDITISNILKDSNVVSILKAKNLYKNINEISNMTKVQQIEYLEQIAKFVKLPTDTVIENYYGRLIIHEQGHLEHRKNFTDNEWEEFKQDTFVFKMMPHVQRTAAKVSRYATSSPTEFVAEVYSGLINGQKFDNDVMEMYKMYRGPQVQETEARQDLRAQVSNGRIVKSNSNIILPVPKGILEAPNVKFAETEKAFAELVTKNQYELFSHHLQLKINGDKKAYIENVYNLFVKDMGLEGIAPKLEIKENIVDYDGGFIPHEYKIEIDASKSEAYLVQTIAHELNHFLQYKEMMITGADGIERLAYNDAVRAVSKANSENAFDGLSQKEFDILFKGIVEEKTALYKRLYSGLVQDSRYPHNSPNSYYGQKADSYSKGQLAYTGEGQEYINNPLEVESRNRGSFVEDTYKTMISNLEIEEQAVSKILEIYNRQHPTTEEKCLLKDIIIEELQKTQFTDVNRFISWFIYNYNI